MKNRREMLKQSAVVASLLASTGLFPQFAHAAFNKAAFDAKSIQDAVKAVAAGALAESKDVTVIGPDIAENGAVVPLGATQSLHEAHMQPSCVIEPHDQRPGFLGIPAPVPPPGLGRP